MATFYTIDTANARLPDVRELLLALQGQRAELIRLRDRLAKLDGTAGDGGAAENDPPAGTRRGAPDAADSTTDTIPAPPAVAPDDEARLLRLRMQGLIDQMQASVGRIDGWGITVRDIETGLIDFPALTGGRQIWLCWRLGEADVEWYHELTTGIAGRRRLVDLT